MFLPWSIFALDAFFLLLEILVVLAFDATLAHLSQRVQRHTQSIRWVYQAGIWELATALYHSRRMKQNAPLRSLSWTLFATVAIFFIVTGAKSLVGEAIMDGKPTQRLVLSRQTVVGNMFASLAGWTFPAPYGTGFHDALTTAVNSSMGIPKLEPMIRYIPQTSTFDVACDRFDVSAPNVTFLVLPSKACATLVFTPSSINARNFNSSRMHSVQRSENHVKIVIPNLHDPIDHVTAANMIADVGFFSRVDYNNETCRISNSKPSPLDATNAGYTSSPRTMVTKCLLTTEETIVLALSNINFVVPSNDMFHSVSTSIFGMDNEMVQAMQENINNSTLATLPPNELEQLTIMEIKLVGTEAIALVCVWARPVVTELPHLSCTYTVTNVRIIKPQKVSPEISRRLVSKGLNPTWTTITSVATLVHYPLVSKSTISFNIPKILDASAVATEYFASISNSFIVDWEGSVLYIIFDTVEILKGYEISSWLVYTIIGVMGICFVFWAATEFVVDVRYRDSLYVTVSRELTQSERNAKPRLHEFYPATQEFEGRRPLVVFRASVPMSNNIYTGRSSFVDTPPSATHGSTRLSQLKKY